MSDTNNDIVLEMKGIHKSFGKLEVLKGINMDVMRGEVVAVIGPSGGGKSTLLRCATTLETVEKGKIVIGGDVLCDDVNGRAVYCDKKLEKEIRSKFGLVFQNFNLFPHFSVRRNITEALIHVHKKSKEEANAICDELLSKMDLVAKADSYPCNLSGGQQQRVSIARALATNPEIIFFDEPTSALDPELTKGVLKVIKELAKEKMTMVIVTHEMSFARDVADKIVFMDGGVIVEEGPAYDLVTNPQQERTKAFLAGY
ncbi:MAG: amino acid ABC transporter ATP-binding protein [Saccharofermentans sp.]|nr:amino acid ABC transporter ATP-binding protein [Saccharofermentans sp.]